MAQEVIDNWYTEVYEPDGELNLSPLPIDRPGGGLTS